MSTNPLFQTSGIPAYDKIQPEHISEAVVWLTKEVTSRLQKIEHAAAQSRDIWASVMEPLDAIDRLFTHMWSPIRHLNSVVNTPAGRTEYEKAQPAIIDMSLLLSQSAPIFKALKAAKADPSRWSKLSPVQQRIIDKQLQSVELSGVGLEGKDKERFNAIENELSQLATKFSNNVLDATKAFALILTTALEVDGLPDHALELAAQSYNQATKTNAATPKVGPWRFTLDEPSYAPFIEFSKRRDLREKIYRARMSRASSGERDNTPLMRQILKLRREKARLLGFQSYAELSLASKMAPDVKAVHKLLEELLQSAKPAAEREMTELRTFAKASGCDYELTDWDLAFWSERMKETKLGLREEELLPYFPMPVVLNGLFSLVKHIFGVTVKPADGEAPVWHPDVRFFRIFDAQAKPIAAFYFDAFSRPESKRGGAWMDTCVDRRLTGSDLELPVAHLVCNGTPAVGDKPSLMSFSQVETLFHEFGHGLQHMLTTVDHIEAAGIRNVEWDAVELPSQFMENWLFHEPTLRSVTAHVDTGKPLPQDLIDKLLASRTYRAAYAMLRQLHFAVTDLDLHHTYDPNGPESPFDLDMRNARRINVLPPRPDNKFLCSFSHIFAGGYAAGYYSYKWAEVLSADAFSAFEESGLDDQAKVAEVGRRFRDTILALGGSKPPLEIFKEFRGREPSPAALLRHSGLVSK